MIKNISGTGTVRQNRLCKIPIKSRKVMEKKNIPRGATDVLYNNDVTLVVWKDNKPVYMASNKHGAETNSTCRRFSRADKKHIEIISIKVFFNKCELVMPMYMCFPILEKIWFFTSV